MIYAMLKMLKKLGAKLKKSLDNLDFDKLLIKSPRILLISGFLTLPHSARYFISKYEIYQVDKYAKECAQTYCQKIIKNYDNKSLFMKFFDNKDAAKEYLNNKKSCQ